MLHDPGYFVRRVWRGVFDTLYSKSRAWRRFRYWVLNLNERGER